MLEVVTYGIDVSSNNDSSSASIDWNAVAASGQGFAWTKATEGSNYINPDLRHNAAGIQAAGMVRGFYHFARPDNNSPQAEVDFFLRAVGDLAPGDLVALDLEVGSGDLRAWAESWVSYCQEQIGFTPMLYSGTWFLQPHNCLYSPILSKCGLWLSGYQENMPSVPGMWNGIALWQFTDKAVVPGVPSAVDQSVFLGSVDELKTYGKEGSVVDKSVEDQLVTILSVIGDQTYPDGSNMDEQASGQPAGVSHRVFQRELVQQGKALLGAS